MEYPKIPPKIHLMQTAGNVYVFHLQKNIGK